MPISLSSFILGRIISKSGLKNENLVSIKSSKNGGKLIVGLLDILYSIGMSKE
jgi:hypothetical protein